ncbi:hypothetical protein V1477_016555 [Vespula maculifrons]|uniref:Uncharacterized protein n=1 Tax=Vespula maculifrons TaxID=7453 RepID=A0ABD2B8N1_VESMC
MVEREVQWKRAWKRAMVKVGRRVRSDVGATKGDSVVLLCDGGDPWNVCKLFQVPEAVSVEGEPAASETTESTESVSLDSILPLIYPHYREREKDKERKRRK